MLAHCINPDCDAALRAFSEGRLFQFEVVSISVAARDDTKLPFDEKPKRQTSHFWLCGNCAAKMLVTLEPLQGLKLIPLADVRTDPVDVTNVAHKDSRTRQLNRCTVGP